MSLRDQVGTVSQERMRQEFEKHQNNGDRANDGVQLFTFRKGITQIRILPPTKNKDHWMKEIREHYVPVGGKRPRVTCLGVFGERCPVCEEGKRLYNSDDPDDLQRSKDLQPKKQYIANALVLSSPDGKTNAASGVQVIKFGVKIEEQLAHLDYDFPGGWGNMTDLDKGFDVRVNRTGDRMENTAYMVQGVPNKTSVAETCAAQGVDADSLVLHDLDTCLDHAPAGKLTAMLKDDYVPGYTSSPEPVEVPTEVPVQPPVQQPSPTVAPPGVVTPSTTGDPHPNVVQESTTFDPSQMTTDPPVVNTNSNVEVPEAYKT